MIIVTYHAVASPASPVCCPPEQLDADLSSLRAGGFSFVSLDDCADWIAGRRELPERSAAITFDDAYESVISGGLPVLKQHGVPATVFVIGSRLGGDNQWPGQWSSIPRMPLADRAALGVWSAAGMSIGSHSWSHAVLPELTAARLSDEIDGSATRLEDALGVPVRHFAFPYGFRGAREVAAARTRYATAVNASPRVVHRGDDAHDLHRLDCHDLRLASRMKWFDPGTLDRYLSARRTLRGARRTIDRWLGRI